MTEYEKLDEFGRQLMENVRDDTLDFHHALNRRQIKSERGLRLANLISKMGSENADSLDEIVINTVDNLLHRFLFMIETTDHLEVVYVDESGEAIPLSQISDGLAGELYSEDGWIEKYSSHKTFL